ncbi:MAG: hypothetical protein R3F54_13985 [Alphaproteobacteria bacterium]
MSKVSKIAGEGDEAPSGKVLTFEAPHPFAAYLRIIGRGATIGRPLDEAEAEVAFAMILGGEVEPLQLGAFLLVLRYRTEAPSELAGSVRASRRHYQGSPLWRRILLLPRSPQLAKLSFPCSRRSSPPAPVFARSR